MDLQVQRLKQKEFKEYHVGAQIACILANVNRNTEKRPAPFDPLDFIPKYLWPDYLLDKPRFDEAGNVEATDLKGMSGAEQQDFLFNLMGGPNAKKSKRRGPENKHGADRSAKTRGRKAKATP